MKTKKISRSSSTSRTLSPSKKTPSSRARNKYIIRLYVAGATARSQQAVLRASELCKNELKGQYKLEVIDIYQQPILARNGQIIATPTLIREFPPPVLRLIGNLSNTTSFFAGLELNTKAKI